MFSKSNSTPTEPHYNVTNPVCGSISCCGLKLNPGILEDGARPTQSLLPHQDDIWLECDDEQISVISRYFRKILFGSKL